MVGCHRVGRKYCKVGRKYRTVRRKHRTVRRKFRTLGCGTMVRRTVGWLTVGHTSRFPREAPRIRSRHS